MNATRQARPSKCNCNVPAEGGELAAVCSIASVTAFLLQGIPLRTVKQLPSKEIKQSHRIRLNVGTVPRTSARL